MNVTVEMKGFEKLTALMNALGPSNRQRLNAVGAKALEVKVRAHVARISSGRHRSAGHLGASPTGHYRKGMRGIAGNATASGGEVVVPIAGISRAYHDIDLSTPTRFGKNYYAIPKHAQSYGHTVAEMRRRGWKIFRPGKKNDPNAPKILLGYKSKGEKPVTLFILTKHVHQKQDPSLLPTPDTCARVVSEAMTQSINERIRNAR